MVPERGDKALAERWVLDNVKSSRGTTTFRDVYEAYERWCWEETLSPPVHVRALANLMEAAGFRRGKRKDTGRGPKRKVSRNWFLELRSTCTNSHAVN